MPDAKRQRLAAWVILVVPAFWAINYVVARKAPGVIGPYVLALGRWAMAGAVLSIMARQELWAQRDQILRDWRQHLVLGFLGMFICGAWVYEGARSTGAMNIALIYAAAPVLISLGSVLFLHEHLRLRQMLGIALALVGVVHVVVRGEWLALAQFQFVVGDLWIVAGTVAWAVYAMLQKYWPSTLSATARLAVTCWGGVVTLIVPTVWELLFEPAMQPGWQPWVLMVAAALGPGVVAYWIYSWAQRSLGASRVSVVFYLGPLWGALVAWGILSEPPGWHHVMGAALILPGVFLATQTSSKPTEQKS